MTRLSQQESSSVKSRNGPRCEAFKVSLQFVTFFYSLLQSLVDFLSHLGFSSFFFLHFTIPTDKIHCRPPSTSALSFWCMIYFKFSSFHPSKKHSIHLCSWREKLEKLRNLIITLTRRKGKKNFIFSTFFSSTISKQLWIFFRLFFLNLIFFFLFFSSWFSHWFFLLFISFFEFLLISIFTFFFCTAWL